MKIKEILRRMLVTRKCLICGEVISYDNGYFCEDCIDQWKQFDEQKCHFCGHTRHACTCLPSQIRQSSKHGAVWCVFYSSKSNLSLNNLVFRLKREYSIDIVDFCADEMAKNLKSLISRYGIDYKSYYITYTPRRGEGRREYGIDHAGKLAKALGERLGIKVIKTLKNIGEIEQKTLTKAQRRENADNSYVIRKNINIKGKSFFLVDDIITSGATMRACIEKLKQAGANDVLPVAYAKDNK